MISEPCCIAGIGLYSAPKSAIPPVLPKKHSFHVYKHKCLVLYSTKHFNIDVTDWIGSFAKQANAQHVRNFKYIHVKQYIG